MANNDSEIKVGVSATTEKLDAGLNQSEQKIKGSADRIKGIFESVKSNTEASIVGLSASVGTMIGDVISSAIANLGTQIKQTVAETVAMVDEARTLAYTFGTTVTEASTLATAIDNAYISADQFASMAQVLSRQLKTNEEDLNKVGLVTRDASGNLKDMQTLMFDGLQVLQQYREGTDRNIVAQTLFGRGAKDLSDAMNVTKESLAAAREEQESLGTLVTKQAKEDYDAYRRAVDDVGDVIKGLRVAIGSALIPVLTELGNWFAAVGPAAVVVVKGAIGGLVSVFWGLKFAAESVWNILAVGVERITIQLMTFADVASHAFKLDFDGAKTAWSNGMRQLEEVTDARMKNILDSAQETRDKLWNLFAKGDDAAKGDGGGKSAPDLSGKDDKAARAAEKEAEKAARAAEKRRQQEMQAEIALAAGKRQLAIAEIAQKQADAQLEQQMGLISKEQLLQQEMQFAEQIKAVKMASLQDQLTVLEKDPNTNPLEFARVKSQMLQEEAQFQQQLAQLRNQLVMTENAPALNIMDSMTSGMEAAMTNMLMMTQSWKQSLVNIYNQVARSFVTELISKQVAEWVKSKMVMLAMEAGFISKEVALKATGATAGAAVTATGATAEVSSKAASGAAGAFSAMASIPYVGPVLGFAAMAAAMAGVMALMGNIKSASGGYDIPSGVNPMTQLHSEEMVLPAQYANVIRGMASGGGRGGSSEQINLNMTVVTPDADSFRSSQRQIDADLSHAIRYARS